MFRPYLPAHHLHTRAFCCPYLPPCADMPASPHTYNTTHHSPALPLTPSHTNIQTLQTKEKKRTQVHLLFSPPAPHSNLHTPSHSLLEEKRLNVSKMGKNCYSLPFLDFMPNSPSPNLISLCLQIGWKLFILFLYKHLCSGREDRKRKEKEFCTHTFFLHDLVIQELCMGVPFWDWIVGVAVDSDGDMCAWAVDWSHK